MPPVDAARVRRVAHARNQGLNAGGVPRAGNRREDVLAHRLLHLRALHVDDRRFAGDGDRLFEGADLQFAVDRGDERCRYSSMPSRLTVLKPGSENVTE